MRILSIAVDGLFGRFNHTIDLASDGRVTVIHGPNGIGKSTLLALVHGMFNRSAEALRAIPFNQLHVGLEDNISLQLTRQSGEVTSLTGKLDIRLQYTLHVPGHDPVSYVPGPDFFALERWYDTRQTQRVLEAFDKRRPRDRAIEPAERWALILDITKEVFPEPAPFLIWTTSTVTHIGMLTARQLFMADNRPARGDKGRVEERSFTEEIEAYSQEVSSALRDAQLEYARTALGQDGSFAARLLGARGQRDDSMTDEALARSLAALDERRAQLATLGLLPAHGEAEAPALESLDDSARAALWLHVRDAQDRLQPFADLGDKVAMLENVIDKRFPYKHLRIDAERGFVFESDTGAELAPSHLSTGERHQLIILYKCLFKQSAGSLMLLDQPELGWHPDWHASFLQDIGEIATMLGFDVLMSTHSPQIIEAHSHTVELHAPAAG